MAEHKRQYKNIAVVGTVGVPARYGGFETLVEQLVSLVGTDYEMHVYCSARQYESRLDEYKGARLHYLPLDANGVSSILYDVISMIHASRYADVILILGVSGCIFLPFLRMFSAAKVVLNIDGMEWRRAKWSKIAKWFLRVSERVGVRAADTVIADNEVIRKYLSDHYERQSVLIPYGADHVKPVGFESSDAERLPFLQGSYAVKVCRIEPENNVHMVLAAFSRLSVCPLVVIGNWDGSLYGRDLRQTYSTCDNVYLLDPIYDQIALDRIRANATIYVHGHSAGGTNPSLVEAMWLGLPILAYDVNYNRETTDGKAKYFGTDASLATLIQGLDAEALKTLGRDMKIIAEERYTWRKVVAQYTQLC